MTSKMLIGSLAALLAACGNEPADAPAEAPIESADEPTTIEAEGPTFSSVMTERAELSTMRRLMQQANLADGVDEARALTIVAPTDEAFAALDPTLREFLLDPANRASLRGVLGYHILRTDIPLTDLKARIEGGTTGTAQLVTSNDFRITASLDEDGMLVLTDGRGNTARVVEADIPAANGTLHVIDTVLLPPQQ